MADHPPSPYAYTPDRPNIATDLADDFHHLTLTSARSVSPLPASSPTPDHRSPSRASSRVRNVSSTRPASSRGVLRKTPSTASLRDERRLSTPGLQKRASTNSLRSASISREQQPSLSRRSSSNLLNTMYSPRPSLEAPIEVPTAASIAADHFKAEMGRHDTADMNSKTMVVIQDACYGHRYARPYTSKDGLATIVERPERLRASILGLSTAYVRVGKRHAGSSFAPHPDLDLGLLPPPPFHIRKSTRAVLLTSPAVTYVHGDKWMGNLKTMCDAAESRLELNGREIVRPRSAGRKDSDEKQLHDGDLYLCPESLDAFQGALGGVCDAVDTVLSDATTKRAFVCIRPPGHHCASADPSGFCWLNNVHVGITHAAMTQGLTHAAIIDFDLHHGDGSQAIAYKQNEQAWNLQQRGGATARNAAPCKKTAIGYYSLHDINSFPCENGEAEKIVNASVCIDNAHGQSIWNVHLEPWRTHDEFWALYKNKYAAVLEKARAFLRFHTQRLEATEGGPAPKAAIFVSAGFDASEFEGAGMQRHKVNVPTDFYARFTADIVRLAEEDGLGVDGRIISVLEGGYSNRALSSGVLSHLSALADTGGNMPQHSRLAVEMSERLGWGNGDVQEDEAQSGPAFETDWWATHFLEELEALAFPPPPATIKKTLKSTPTYFSPTQASIAKVAIPSKERKLSSTSAMDDDAEPLPEVDWATSAHELWKYLIPSDRETMSFQYEELKARAALAKKKKMVVVATTTTPEELPSTPSTATRRQLRARAAKTTSSSPDTPAPAPRPRPNNKVSATPKVSTPRRVSARNSSRRTTIGTASDLPEPPTTTRPSTNTKDDQPRRRQSTTAAEENTAAAATENKSTPSRASSRPPSQSPAGGVTGRKNNNRELSAGGVGGGESRTSTPKRLVSSDKAPPLPKVPSLYMNMNKGQAGGSAGGSTDGGARMKPEEENDGIEQLSTGVKKLNIKLKVPPPPPEENNSTPRRERKSKTPDPQKSRKTTTTTTTKTEPKSVSKPSSKRNIAAPKTVEKPIAPKAAALPPQKENVATGEYEVPIKVEIPSEPDDSNSTSISGLEGYQGFSNVQPPVNHYNPLHQYSENSVATPLSPLSPSPYGFPGSQVYYSQQQEPLHQPLHHQPLQQQQQQQHQMQMQMQMPPTPRQNLPVFTSTSQIPFAAAPPPAHGQGYGQSHAQPVVYGQPSIIPQGPFLQQFDGDDQAESRPKNSTQWS
ncbi:uncharacterized protein TRUGW13939_01976 [Talaromyces rugulosus]|uniref:Histone deacetylase domain-containing protein n=1 Tax=Talaromyces rugulosus TaxID=121627 RepID=A0A7H8QLX1_TALRU|nr:uncharacterized protein TRUGW13939_01976 [Talaromyces rugulosus]QKX54886.1 hypothetical protein TRUGW13939_01976 [Talaromyces rugulosus]